MLSIVIYCPSITCIPNAIEFAIVNLDMSKYCTGTVGFFIKNKLGTPVIPCPSITTFSLLYPDMVIWFVEVPEFKIVTLSLYIPLLINNISPGTKTSTASCIVL